MFMQKFKIADILIEIISDKSIQLSTFRSFLSSSMDNPDLRIQIENCSKITHPDGVLIIEDEVKWMYKYQGDKSLVVYVCEEDSDEIILLLEVNESWDDANIKYLDGINVEYPLKGIFGSILFRNSILFHNGFVIHASAIKFNGRGILFSAPSGTGKSTHARLWKDYLGAGILNDDCPCVRIFNEDNYIYGTPWSGSSEEFINDSTSLSAIVILEQSKENFIRRLNNNEAVLKLIPRCFLPFYDRNTMNLAIGNIERVISKTPVYLLKCRPDMEAVKLVQECVV